MIFFLLILLLLFFSSQLLTSLLSQVLTRVVRSHAVGVRILSLFFLPGVIIHEFSHALMAHLLFVPVGRMEFMPVVDGDHVKLGSVQIGKTDSFRRMLIGFAPIIVGIGLLWVLLYYFMPQDLSFVLEHLWRVILLIYSVFVISNTMFSSRKDMEGVPLLLGIILIIGISGYLLGFRIPGEVMRFLQGTQVEEYLQTGSLFLAVPLGINIIAIFMIRLVLR